MDEEMIRDMLDWLSRGMDAQGKWPEEEGCSRLEWTNEDRDFLRSNGILAA